MPVNLHFNDIGRGKPVIILHGLFGSSRNWQGIAKELASEFRVITVDLRNHGQSESADSMTYPEMAEDVYHLMSRLSLEQPALIGHSMGGKVAMMTALEYQKHIKNLIVLDIAPVNYGHRYGKIFAAMNSLQPGQITSRNEAEDLMNQTINDSSLTRFLLQNLARSGPGFQWRINIKTIEKNIELINTFPENIDSLKYGKPALFLGGKNSNFIQLQFNKAILDLFPAAVIELIENAGHMLHIEHAETVIGKIRNFLYRCT